MGDPISEDYKDGDIVWVKLGGYWWPGEVKDLSNVPKDVASRYKKTPLAVVQFFDEDFYEDVKHASQILQYNCSKKMECIKKGLDGYRAKVANMEKFPSDVLKAESKTNGDPNILDDPYFLPEKKKTNYAALIFGSTSPKKPPKDGAGRGKGRPSLGKSPKKPTPSPDVSITHAKFLDKDHKVRILVQSPRETEQEEMPSYSCAMCSFQTSRIEVIVLHNKSHILGVYTPVSTTKKGKRSPGKKPAKRVVKMSHSKTSTIDEDLALLEKGLPLTVDSSEEDDIKELPKPKRKSKQTTSPKQKQKKTEKKGENRKDSTKEKTVKLDVSKDILADWEDDSDTEPELNVSKPETVSSDAPSLENKVEFESKIKELDKSCFDFEDDEEHEIVSAASGRKIPRVIPHSDKQTSDQDDATDLDTTGTEDNDKSKEIQDVSVSSVEESDKKANDVGDLNVGDFDSILEATSVPKLPEIPTLLKCEQNFHNDKTVKFPDKSELPEKASKVEKEPPEPSKLINPKKRFVKSFEDFELFQSEQRKLEAQKKKDQLEAENEYKEKNVEIMEEVVEKVEKRKYIAEGELCDEKSHCKSKKTDINSLVDVKIEVEKPKVEIKSPKHITADVERNLDEDTITVQTNETKLIEDIPIVQPLESKPDDGVKIENKSEDNNEVVSEPKIEVSKLKSQLISKLPIEDNESKLEVSKLKTQLMSKLSPDKATTHSKYSVHNIQTRSSRRRNSSDLYLPVPETKTKAVSPEKELMQDKEPVHNEEVQRKSKRKIRKSQKLEESLNIQHISSPEPPVKLNLSEERVSFSSKRSRKYDEFGQKEEKVQDNEDLKISSQKDLIKEKEQSSLSRRGRRSSKLDAVASEKIESTSGPVKISSSSSRRGRRSHRHEEFLFDSLDRKTIHSELEDESLSKRSKIDDDKVQEPKVSLQDSVVSPKVSSSRKDRPSKLSKYNRKKSAEPKVEKNVTEAENNVVSTENDSVAAENIKDLRQEKEVLSETDVTDHSVEALKQNEIVENVNLYKKKVEVKNEFIKVEQAAVIRPNTFNEELQEPKTEDAVISIQSEVPITTPKLLKMESKNLDLHEIEPEVSKKEIKEQVCSLEVEPSVNESKELKIEHVVIETVDHELKIQKELQDAPKSYQEEEIEIESSISNVETEIVTSEQEVSSKIEIESSNIELETDKVKIGEPENSKVEVQMLEVPETETLNEVTIPSTNVSDIEICTSEEVVSESAVIKTDVETSSTELLEDLNVSNKHVVEENESCKNTEAKQEILTGIEINQKVDENELISISNKSELLEDNFENKNTISEKKNESNLKSNNSAELPFNHESKQFSLLSDQFMIPENEEMSALTTLAAVSEMSTNLETTNLDETVPIDNLTVVTEQDLADKQVEIATNVLNESEVSKPITLSSFSLDFSDSNSADLMLNEKLQPNLKKLEAANKTDVKSSNEKIKSVEKEYEHKFFNTDTVEKKSKSEEHVKTKPHNSKSSILCKGLKTADVKNCDVEEQIPSAIVSSGQNIESEMAKITNTNPDTETVVRQPEQSSSSFKLLEILTDTRPKSAANSVSVNKSPSSQLKQKFEELKSLNEISITKRQLPNVEHMRNSKLVIKPSPAMKVNQPNSKANKPIILSEKIIKPISESDSVSVQKVTSKRTYQDVEDIDTFIIQKPTKKVAISSEEKEKVPTPTVKQPVKKPSVVSKGAGKARILQQTIITPAGDIIQPTVSTQNDETIFDINSMPIVLSDQILTPESIENMPIMLSESIQPSSEISIAVEKPIPKPIKKSQIRLLNKTPPVALRESTPSPKTYIAQKVAKTHKIYQPQPSSTKLKHSPTIITQPGKPGKFIVVPSTTPTGNKYTVGKKPQALKRSNLLLQTSPQPAKVQNVNPEPSGNKIMIVTNQQGQQSRVLLTPAQQKMLGYQTPSKTTKGSLKSPVVQKSVLTKGGIAGSSRANVISQAIASTKAPLLSNQNVVASQVLSAVSTQQVRNLKIEPKTKKIQNQRLYLQSGLTNVKSSVPTGHKTIIIKNQHGQTLKKLQATDDALLDQQVQEQIQAIKASEKFLSGVRAQVTTPKSVVKPPLKRVLKKPLQSDVHKQIISTKPQQTRNLSSQHVLNVSAPSMSVQNFSKSEASIPPLAPISPPKKVEQTVVIQSKPQPELKVEAETQVVPIDDKKQEVQRPLNQLVIQDAMGNQTTITEGQILALPSETVDGQPQSYMLVTLDETGNLTPLNNEALMSLDQNLGLGGDLSNMVLQIDQGTANIQDGSMVTEGTVKIDQSAQPIIEKESNSRLKKSVPEQIIAEPTSSLPQNAANVENEISVTTDNVEVSQQGLDSNSVQTVACSLNSDAGQQLLVTGDVLATQKFLESLTEGNSDLANILANAEGSSILIQTDGQQILINTEPDNNQVLLSLNNDNLNIIENSESGGNPIFATQPSKNQDILAAALADTDVFQQEQNGPALQNKVTQSQLSPNSTSLYPMNVSNVLETSLTLSSPIMTPLEVPSTNNKKIPDDEADILTQVPKNVDLPITITDPNISQTVSNQHVASLITSDLPNNLELPLSISDTSMSVTATEMNSPSYVYSLPTLDDSVDINPKTFTTSISMPLLTEEPEDNVQEETNTTSVEDIATTTTVKFEEKNPQEEEIKSNTEAPVTSVEEELPSTSAEIPPQTTSTAVVDVTAKLQSSKIAEVEPYLEEEGLCTLGGEMCSSLSEPPPDMFDVENPTYISSEIKETSSFMLPKIKEITDIPEQKTDSSTNLEPMNHSEDTQPDVLGEDNHFESSYEENDVNLFNISENSPSTNNTDENSCEIPVQPPIVTDLMSATFDNFESNSNNSDDNAKRCFSAVDDSEEGDNKKRKFD